MNHSSSVLGTVNADDANRGTIIRIPDAQPGLLVSDGKQYEFTLSGIWQGPAAPALNQKVSFTLTPEGRIASIHVLGRDVLANETLSAFGQTLRSNGGSLGAVMLPYLRQQRNRMTLPGMVMSGALLLGFYVLPGWTLDAGNTMLGMRLDYTLNQLLGVQMGGAGITVQFGFWRLLGCAITLQPWVTPWLGCLLNILPLLLLLALPLVVHARLHHLAAEAAQSTGQLLGGFGGNAAMQHDLQSMVQKQATASTCAVGALYYIMNGQKFWSNASFGGADNSQVLIASDAGQEGGFYGCVPVSPGQTRIIPLAMNYSGGAR